MGFVGGVCLVVSGARNAAGSDDSSSSADGGDDAWAAAASVVLRPCGACCGGWDPLRPGDGSPWSTDELYTDTFRCNKIAASL